MPNLNSLKSWGDEQLRIYLELQECVERKIFKSLSYREMQISKERNWIYTILCSSARYSNEPDMVSFHSICPCLQTNTNLSSCGCKWQSDDEFARFSACFTLP
jgi:hypothetical protein